MTLREFLETLKCLGVKLTLLTVTLVPSTSSTSPTARQKPFKQLRTTL